MTVTHLAAIQRADIALDYAKRALRRAQDCRRAAAIEWITALGIERYDQLRSADGTWWVYRYLDHDGTVVCSRMTKSGAPSRRHGDERVPFDPASLVDLRKP